MSNRNPIDGLSLDQFVSLAITEITNGVRQAAQELQKEDVLINPTTTAKNVVQLGSINDNRQVQHIYFDLTVTAVSNQKADAGIQIRVLNYFNAGGKIADGTNNTTTSRIKFSIPVSFPTNMDFAQHETPRAEIVKRHNSNH